MTLSDVIRNQERDLQFRLSVPKIMLLRYFLALLLFVLIPFVSRAQYNANTSTAVIAYPRTIPCPASSCSGGGSLVGVNTTITPSDFTNPITRVTDNFSLSSTQSYNWSYSGGAYPVPFDRTDTRFVVYTASGNQAVPFSWNPATLQATKLYGSSYTMTTPQPYTSVTFSFTQPYIGYALSFNGSSDPAIYSYDFTSTTTAPTGVPLVDLSTCVPALAGLGYETPNDLVVSQDDQTFGIDLSSTPGQGSSGDVYVVIWNRTTGCRVWNTATGAVTGAWGTMGTVGISDKFRLHDATLGEGGTWAYVVAATCLSNCNTSPTWKGYFWDISTLAVTGLTSDSACGHFAAGYSLAVNECDFGSGHYQATWYERPMSPPNTIPPTGVINSNNIPNYTTPQWDQHPSWATDNSSDTAPFCTTVFNGQFAVSGVYDNEVVCIAMNGTGTVWRFGHTYSSYQSASFEAQNVIGAVSADGKLFLWTSDWDGMLGNTSGASSTCTLGTNCRNDVFIMALPQSTVTVAPNPPI